MGDIELYCKICNINFKTWEEVKKHRLGSTKHNACIFCAADFRTQDGRKRHQDQQHAAAQDLECYGCGENFQRAGSYVNHIESMMCPVIHPAEFQRRHTQQALIRQRMRDAESANGPPHTKPATSAKVESIPTSGTYESKQPSDARLSASNLIPSITNSQTQRSGSTELPYLDSRLSICDGDLLVFEDSPKRPAWGVEVDQPLETPGAALFDLDTDFPSLSGHPKVNKKNQPTSELPKPDKLDVKNKAWIDELYILPDAPKPVSPVKLRQAVLRSAMKENDWRELDPDDPRFNARQYFNPINSKYKCAWPGCKSLLPSATGLISHLRSAAHMDLKLRCPSCLRMYLSYTALIQHAESQAKKCDIRNTTEYKHALDQVGGLISITGLHDNDKTKKYKVNTAEERAEADRVAVTRIATQAEEQKLKSEEKFRNMIW